MKGWMVALAATLALSLAPAQSKAGFCGIARYSCCDPVVRWRRTPL